MEFITMTQLRTHSPQILSQLNSGKSLRILHRSKVVGRIVPETEAASFNYQVHQEILKSLPTLNITAKQARAKYRQHLKKKYGQGLS